MRRGYPIHFGPSGHNVTAWRLGWALLPEGSADSAISKYWPSGICATSTAKYASEVAISSQVANRI